MDYGAPMETCQDQITSHLNILDDPLLCTTFRGTQAVERPRSKECTWTWRWGVAPDRDMAQLDCALPSERRLSHEGALPVRIITTGRHAVDTIILILGRSYRHVPHAIILVERTVNFW
jgi:hypothetical protein